MANTNLEALRPVLEEIPIHEVDEPEMPMAVALQEGHDLAVFICEEQIREALLKVGVKRRASTS